MNFSDRGGLACMACAIDRCDTIDTEPCAQKTKISWTISRDSLQFYLQTSKTDHDLR